MRYTYYYLIIVISKLFNQNEAVPHHRQTTQHQVDATGCIVGLRGI